MCRQDAVATLKTISGVALENKDLKGRRAEWCVGRTLLCTSVTGGCFR